MPMFNLYPPTNFALMQHALIQKDSAVVGMHTLNAVL